jgi:hypothetical protein
MEMSGQVTVVGNPDCCNVVVSYKVSTIHEKTAKLRILMQGGTDAPHLKNHMESSHSGAWQVPFPFCCATSIKFSLWSSNCRFPYEIKK